MGNAGRLYHAVALAALVLAAPASARSELWATLGAYQDGTEVWLDFSSIRMDPAQEYSRPFPARMAWVKLDYSNNRKVRARELLQYVAFDCANGRHLTLQAVMRYPDGSAVAADDTPDIAGLYRATTPDSIMAEVADWVCKQK